MRIALKIQQDITMMSRISIKRGKNYQINSNRYPSRSIRKFMILENKITLQLLLQHLQHQFPKKETPLELHSLVPLVQRHKKLPFHLLWKATQRILSAHLNKHQRTSWISLRIIWIFLETMVVFQEKKKWLVVCLIQSKG